MAMSPRLLRPRAAGGFNPKTIAGLQLWLDAADASTVTTVSGAASQWNDKSGNGRHATQGTANNRPAYNGVIGGKAALTFDGTNDAMATGLESASLTGYATFFCVCRPNFADATAAGFRAPLYGRDSTTSNAYGLNLLNTSGTLTLNTQWRGVGFNQSGGPTVTLGIDAIMVGGITATQYVRRISGVAANLTTTPTAGTNSAAGNFLNVGQDPTQLRWWNGPVGEVLVYNRDLSLAEIQTIERYLTTKWAIGVRPTASNADAQAWINNVYANGGEVSTATAAAVNTFANDIESAGLRDRFYRLNLFAGSNLSAALVPLYRGTSLGGTQTGNVTDTNENFVSGDYVETGATSGGLGTGATNSTKSLDTGLVPFNAGITHDNSHLCFYSRGGNSTTGAVIASGRSTAPQELLQWFINGTTGSVGQFYRSGGPSGSGIEGPSALRTGHMIAQRSGSGGAIFRNGSNLGLTSTTTSVVTFATDLPPALRVFGRNLQGSVDQRIATTLQGYSIGRAFTDAQALAYYNAMQTFQTALGRQL